MGLIFDPIIPDRFEPINNNSGSSLQFRHLKTGIVFNYIPAGIYSMGFSENEERAAQALNKDFGIGIEEMRPITIIKVKPLLVSCYPILNYQAKLLIPNFHYLEAYPYHPAYFSRKDALHVAESCDCRLLREAEWEYCCRAGTQSLFVWGDTLPDDAELAKWLVCDYLHPDYERKNAFGLKCLFYPEWCLDNYKIDYKEKAERIKGSYVIRGGGAYFWPWQDEEWVWCMSAMRWPSVDLIDNEACLRLAYELC